MSRPYGDEFVVNAALARSGRKRMPQIFQRMVRANSVKFMRDGYFTNRLTLDAGIRLIHGEYGDRAVVIRLIALQLPVFNGDRVVGKIFPHRKDLARPRAAVEHFQKHVFQAVVFNCFQKLFFFFTRESGTGFTLVFRNKNSLERIAIYNPVIHSVVQDTISISFSFTPRRSGRTVYCAAL